MWRFRFLQDPPPSDDLKSALEAVHGRLDALERTFERMRVDWEVITAHIDQQSNKVHRELGHVTRRQREIKDADGTFEQRELELTENPRRRSRFAGGRHP